MTAPKHARQAPPPPPPRDPLAAALNRIADALNEIARKTEDRRVMMAPHNQFRSRRKTAGNSDAHPLNGVLDDIADRAIYPEDDE